MTTTAIGNRQTKKQLVREFLRLPAEALPAASYLDPADAEDLGSPWQQLREYAHGADTDVHCGERVLLTADRTGWRDGVEITLR